MSMNNRHNRPTVSEGGTVYVYTDDATAADERWPDTGYNPIEDIASFEDFSDDLVDEIVDEADLDTVYDQVEFLAPNVELIELTTEFTIGRNKFTKTRTVWRILN